MENTLLLAMGELVRRQISANELLHRIVDVMARNLDADRGTLFVLDDESDELVSVAAHLPEMPSLRVPRNQGIAGAVARTGRMIRIDDCDDDARFWKEIDATTGYATVSMLAGPLRDRHGNLIGVAQFLNKRSGAFTLEDEQAFVVLAQQVAALLQETTLSHQVNYLPAAPIAAPAPEQTVAQLSRINGLVGKSVVMELVYRAVLRVAPTDATVLLRGDSGTGKGLVAKAIHDNSRRSDALLVHVACTALPDGLVENELFGHEKGAYTGADTRRLGKVEIAAGGTLFLDEIGDLPLSLQGKLLTLLQERTYNRVGGTQVIDADIRVVAATNRDLEALVREGRFREDLYYRLRVVEIHMPRLVERGRQDLGRLINHFVAAAAKRHGRHIERVAPDAMERLYTYPWPGNVRELENCLESAVIFADSVITPAHLPLAPPGSSRVAALRPIVPAAEPVTAAHTPSIFDDAPSIRELERRYIQHLLAHHEGNRSACARVLGIGRNTLLRKLREYGLDH